MTWLRWIILGCALGAATAASPGSVFVLALVAVTSVWLWKLVEANHRRFIVGWFVAGFALRALLSVGLDVGATMVLGSEAAKHYSAPNWWDLGVIDRTRTYLNMGDSDNVSERGYAMAQFAKGVAQHIVGLRTQQSYGSTGYSYVIAAFYYLFDFSPHAVKLVNCFIGALLGPLIFLLAKRCFHTGVARWTDVAVTLCPSLMLWSATNLKEPSLHLLTAAILLLTLKLQESRLSSFVFWGWLAILSGAAAAHATLRSPMYTLVLLACSALVWLLFSRDTAPVWSWRRHIPVRLRLVLAAGLAIAAITSLGTIASVERTAKRVLAKAFYFHTVTWGVAGSSYQYLPQEFYESGRRLSEWERTANLFASKPPWPVPELVLWSGRAVYHFLVQPIPGTLRSAMALLSFPQLIAWYALLPFVLTGMIQALQRNVRHTLLVVLSMGAWLLLGALTNGNVGTVFRMRDMITPFLLMLACAQIWRVTFGSMEETHASH